MRIFSSAEYCLRVARRMFLTSHSDGEPVVPDFYLISTPRVYDEPEILSSSRHQICLTGADAGHAEATRDRLTFVVQALRTLFADEWLMTLLRTAGLDSLPCNLASGLQGV